MSELLNNLITHPSHWHATANLGALPKASPLPARAKYCIVGLGIAGASLAYELVAQGVPPEHIVVLDGARTAFGASGRNGGFVLSFPGEDLLDWHARFGDEGTVELVKLNIRNRKLVRDFVEAHGLWHQAGGSYFAAWDESEAIEVRRCHELLERLGFRGYDLLETLPGPSSKYFATVFQRGDIGIHPVDYAAALVRAAGVRVVEDCAVASDGFVVAQDGVTVHTSRGDIECETLLLATNAYTGIFFNALAPTFPVTVARNQVLLARVEGETTNRLWGNALYYTRWGFDYWRQFPDGTILLGGGRNHDIEGETTAEMADNPKVLAYLEGEVMQRLSGGRPVEILRRWQGIMGFSPDHLPMTGWLPGAEGRVLFAGAFSGYGLGLHRVLVEAATRLLLRRESAGVFGVERLESSKHGE